MDEHAKELRKAIKRWIRAYFLCYHVEMRSHRSVKMVEEAEASMWELVTGEKSIFNAALAVKSPAALDMVPKYVSHYPECDTQEVDDIIKALTREAQRGKRK